MNERKKEPLIRFVGFTGDWEQRKAADIAEYSKGNGYSKNDLVEVGTPIILYGRLYTKYQFAINEVDTFAAPQRGSVYSQGNEVIIPASGETAEDIARASAVEKSGILLGGDLNILRPFDYLNPPFLALAISSGNTQKELAKKSQGKSVVHIHNSDIQEVTIFYPERTEQDRIVTIFRTLDNLITLHQRKCDLLEQTKKTYLQKLFPRDGENVPEMRFAGFEEEWTERILGDVLVERNIQHPQNSDYPLVSFTVENGVTPKTERYEREQLVRGSKDAKKYKQTKLDDIVYNPANLKFGAIARNSYGSAVFSPIYITFEVNLLLSNPNYIEMYVTRRDFIKQSLKYQQGTVYERQSVNPESLLNMPLALPAKGEQQKIGILFQSINTLIIQHKEKLATLKTIKETLLNQMFI